MLLSFVPLTIQGVVSNSQAVSGLGNLLGKIESYQRGFNWNIPFKCRRLKPWVDFFPENIRRVEKQADSYFGVVDAQEIPGGKPEVWLALPSELLPHDLVTGGIPYAGSWHVPVVFLPESLVSESILILLSTKMTIESLFLLPVIIIFRNSFLFHSFFTFLILKIKVQ